MRGRARRGVRVTGRGWAVIAVMSALALAGSRWALLEFLSSPGTVDAAGVEAAPASPPASPSPSVPPTPAPAPPPLPGPAVAADLEGPVARVTLDGGRDATHAAAEAFFETAPVVVVVDGSSPALDAGAWLALRFRAPLLLDGPDIGVTLGRLGAVTALTVGAVGPLPLEDVREIGSAAPSARAWSEPGTGEAAAEQLLARRWGVHRLRAFADGDRSPVELDLTALGAERGRAWVAAEDPATVLVRRGDDLALTGAASAVAAGHQVAVLAADDPRADPGAREELAGLELDRLALLGSPEAWEAASPDSLPWQLAVAQEGLELPGGGQLIFPHRRLVALYGTPGSGALGVLGEQPVDEAVVRAREQAAAYDQHSDTPVVPTFEIIATVASASAGPDGDYSTEHDVATLRPWVDAARAAGVYVVLDLQPGRSDFLSQAQRYEELLVEPHVGLALDPEWRLGPGQRHLVQIGGVDAAEVNQVADWLAGLVRDHRLPQKLLVVHQFKLSMIRDRATLVSRPELATLIQMDGQGGQPVKLDTWNAIRRDPPRGMWWGWKNFHDEDLPMRSPAETMSLDPEPVFVSYQ